MIKPDSVDQYDEFPSRMPIHSRPNYYKLPFYNGVACTNAYRNGSILPIDPSSLLALDNLLLQSTDHVLDLCCAPGAKLSLMALRSASVTGVDISKQRIGATVSLVKKYHLNNVRLFLTDGQHFDTTVHHVSERERNIIDENFESLYDAKEKRPYWCSSRYRKQRGHLGDLYDKVLVDAQCTHDGSIKHIRKHIESCWKHFNPEHFEKEGLAELCELQYQLLCNGFRLLKPNGIVVYSTCSLSSCQNQCIVERFIRNHENAIVEDPVGSDESIGIIPLENGTKAIKVQPGPEIGGGFFLCRIRKT